MKKYVIGIVILCVAVLGFFFYPKTERMSIVFACSDSYVPHVGTAITSILMNADKDDKFDFYILQDDISEENKQKFEELKRIKDFNIKFIQVDKDRFSKIKSKHVSYFYRFIIPEIISKKKALYLDADILVLSSLSSLWQIDVTGVYAGVVEDCCVQQQKKLMHISNHFNSGVMLLNLEKIRTDNIVKELFKTKLEIQNDAKFFFQDQDTLNIVFNENVTWLPKKYNEYDVNHMSEAVIFHFIHLWKPVEKYSLPAVLYWDYRRHSPWAEKIFWLHQQKIEIATLQSPR